MAEWIRDPPGTELTRVRITRKTQNVFQAKSDPKVIRNVEIMYPALFQVPFPAAGVVSLGKTLYTNSLVLSETDVKPGGPVFMSLMFT